MKQSTWTCSKCNHNEFETDRIRTSGGGISAIFDVDNKKFHTLSCTRCGYTELYRTKTSTLANVVDLFTT